MCGRYALFAEKTKIEQAFGASFAGPDLFNPSYNVAPGSFNPVLILGKGGVRRIGPLRWGLIPSWAKDQSGAYKTINAKAETLADKPSFRQAYKSRRCIVPVSGFYEWMQDTKPKRPFFIRTNEDVFGLAGLYERWESGGEVLFTYTIITTEPNALTSQVHHRMPVILEKEDYGDWLDPQCGDREHLASMLRPFLAENMALHEVGTEVSKPGTEGPELVRPLSP